MRSAGGVLRVKATVIWSVGGGCPKHATEEVGKRKEVRWNSAEDVDRFSRMKTRLSARTTLTSGPDRRLVP